jgi:hypothetical protein
MVFLNDDPTSVTVIPTPSAVVSPGYFTNGNPTLSVPATIVQSDFLNSLIAELLAVITASGLTPSKTNNGQLLQAIQELITAAGATSSTALTEEAALRAAADNSEATTRASAISSETATRAAGDTAEATTRAAADTAEATARASAISSEASTRASAIATEASARQAIFGATSIVTSARSQSTVYVNSNGRPLFVSVYGITTGAGANLVFAINSVAAAEMGQASVGSEVSVWGMVPAGSYYQIYATIAAVSIQQWMETY